MAKSMRTGVDPGGDTGAYTFSRSVYGLLMVPPFEMVSALDSWHEAGMDRCARLVLV